MEQAPPEDFLRRYADVAVRVGANVQPGQKLVVISSVEHVPLARRLMEAGWRAGAGDVEVVYTDDYERYLLAKYGADERLTRTSVAYRAVLEAALEQQGASIGTLGETVPAYFADADEDRLARTQPRLGRELNVRIVNEHRDAWCVIGYPEPSWARRVFGEPDVARLTAEIAHACRLDEPDPVAAWREHLDRLRERVELLNERRLDRVHLHGSGTDVEIGLLPQSRWAGGNVETAWGQVHCPNLPTEEVFTTPDRRRAEGVLRATRPVAYSEGALVEGIELRFAGGRIVEASATAGQDFLRRHIQTDEGASRLGELALVAGSPVGARGLLFYNTLFDENAASHVAYGMGYTSPVEGAQALDERAQLELGINQSTVHVDFAVGGAGVEIDGIDARGERVPIVAGDEWLLR